MDLLWGMAVGLAVGIVFNFVRIERLEEELSKTRNELVAEKQRRRC